MHTPTVNLPKLLFILNHGLWNTQAILFEHVQHSPYTSYLTNYKKLLKQVFPHMTPKLHFAAQEDGGHSTKWGYMERTPWYLETPLFRFMKRHGWTLHFNVSWHRQQKVPAFSTFLPNVEILELINNRNDQTATTESSSPWGCIQHK